MRLCLFFTRRVGLVDWCEAGILDREVELYRELDSRLDRVTFITYGGRRDALLAERVYPIHVCATPPRLPTAISQVVLARKCRHVLEHSAVIKTNQIPGSEVALWAARRYGAKLIVRCGYLYSQFMEKHTSNRWRIGRAHQLERSAFAQADAGIVTTDRDRQQVVALHGIDPDKIHVVPNYVRTDLFRPMPNVRKTHDLVCVARSAPQKNLTALVEALSLLQRQGSAASLQVVGSAKADDSLRRLARQRGVDVTWRGTVPNEELPTYLNGAVAFILPSLYEGHPKALIEAMSCGLPCIGSDVEGIREEISHAKNGFLSSPDAPSLAAAISQVLNSAELRRQLSTAARARAVARYSVGAVVEKELAVIRRVAG